MCFYMFYSSLGYDFDIISDKEYELKEKWNKKYFWASLSS